MLSKDFKRKIAVVSLTFFLSTSFNFSFTNTLANAAGTPLPPNQGQVKQPPPRRSAAKPAAPRNIQKPSTAKPAVRPRQNVNPARRPAGVKQQPVRTGNTRPSTALHPKRTNARPAVKPQIGSSVKPQKPNTGNAVRPPHSSGQNKRPAPSHNNDINKKPAVSQGNKKPVIRPRPDNDKNKLPIPHKNNIGNKKPGPNDKRPALRPQINGEKPEPSKDKRPPSRPIHDGKKPSKPHHNFNLHDRFVPPPPPHIHYRTPRWLLFAGGFAYASYPRTVVNNVVVDYSYLNTAGDVYLDNFVKTKYIEGEYDGQDYYADYYIDKNSLEVVRYNPPDYIIRVNEVSFDNMNEYDTDPYITTWELRYNLDYRTVYFRNVYDPYEKDPEDWTFLNVYSDEYYMLPTAEMAFYLAYKYRFFDNQPDSFYDVNTL